jgi:hypothetical protein
VDLDEVLAATFSLVGPHLTERQRRLLLGAAARALGYGGVGRVARLAEASRPTVRRGAVELDQPADPRGRIRQHQGPKWLRDRDPGLLEMLDRLVEPDTRGDPESPLRWTCKSTRELAQALTAAGHPVSDDTVGRLLKQQGYRLQRTRGSRPPPSTTGSPPRPGPARDIANRPGLSGSRVVATHQRLRCHSLASRQRATVGSPGRRVLEGRFPECVQHVVCDESRPITDDAQQ